MTLTKENVVARLRAWADRIDAQQSPELYFYERQEEGALCLTVREFAPGRPMRPFVVTGASLPPDHEGDEELLDRRAKMGAGWKAGA